MWLYVRFSRHPQDFTTKALEAALLGQSGGGVLVAKAKQSAEAMLDAFLKGDASSEGTAEPN